MSLFVELTVHEEVNHKHNHGDHKENHAEGYRTRNAYVTSQGSEHRRENHTGGHTQTGKGHLRTHGKGHFTTLEPLDNASAHGYTGHFHAAAEYHEAYSREFGRSRHAFIEWRDAKLIENGNVVQMVGEPYFKRASEECVGEGIPVDCGSHEHHGTRQERGEAHTHFVEDNACENQEEDKYVEECLGALHGAESS